MDRYLDGKKDWINYKKKKKWCQGCGGKRIKEKKVKKKKIKKIIKKKIEEEIEERIEERIERGRGEGETNEKMDKIMKKNR